MGSIPIVGTLGGVFAPPNDKISGGLDKRVTPGIMKGTETPSANLIKTMLIKV